MTVDQPVHTVRLYGDISASLLRWLMTTDGEKELVTGLASDTVHRDLYKSLAGGDLLFHNAGVKVDGLNTKQPSASRHSTADGWVEPIHCIERTDINGLAYERWPIDLPTVPALTVLLQVVSQGLNAGECCEAAVRAEFFNMTAADKWEEADWIREADRIHTAVAILLIDEPVFPLTDVHPLDTENPVASPSSTSGLGSVMAEALSPTPFSTPGPLCARPCSGRLSMTSPSTSSCSSTGRPRSYRSNDDVYTDLRKIFGDEASRFNW